MSSLACIWLRTRVMKRILSDIGKIRFVLKESKGVMIEKKCQGMKMFKVTDVTVLQRSNNFFI